MNLHSNGGGVYPAMDVLQRFTDKRREMGKYTGGVRGDLRRAELRFDSFTH